MNSAPRAGSFGSPPLSAPMMKPKISSSSSRCRIRRSTSRPRHTPRKNPPTAAMIPAKPSDLFFDAGGLAGQVAQVVELGAAHVAAALHRDAVDGRAVQLEHALHAFAVADLAHGHGGVEAAVAARDHDALVGLHALAVAFLHLHVHHDGVAGLELRHLAGGAFG